VSDDHLMKTASDVLTQRAAQFAPRRRGLQVGTFSSQHEALEWLNDDLVAPPGRNAELSQLRLMPNGVVTVTATRPIDWANAMHYTINSLNGARRHGSDMILVYGEVHLSFEERKWVAMNMVDWLDGQGYSPKLAMVSKVAGDKYGIRQAAKRGLTSETFPDESEALRWLN
jgi:hypothetical protein